MPHSGHRGDRQQSLTNLLQQEFPPDRNMVINMPTPNAPTFDPYQQPPHNPNGSSSFSFPNPNYPGPPPPPIYTPYQGPNPIPPPPLPNIIVTDDRTRNKNCMIFLIAMFFIFGIPIFLFFERSIRFH